MMCRFCSDRCALISFLPSPSSWRYPAACVFSPCCPPGVIGCPSLLPGRIPFWPLWLSDSDTLRSPCSLPDFLLPPVIPGCKCPLPEFAHRRAFSAGFVLWGHFLSVSALCGKSA